MWSRLRLRLHTRRKCQDSTPQKKRKRKHEQFVVCLQRSLVINVEMGTLWEHVGSGNSWSDMWVKSSPSELILHLSASTCFPRQEKAASSEHQHWRVFPIDLFWCDSSASVSGNTTQRWETLNWILLKSQIWCDVHWWAATTRPSLHSSCVMMRHRVF